MKTAIVLTTINLPTVLSEYAANIADGGHRDVAFVIAGDLTTPKEAADYVQSLNSTGIETHYLGPKEQERFLRRCTDFASYLPYNTVQRRNVAFLYAASHIGAVVLVSIDDDNQPLAEHDFIGEHNIVGSFYECPAISTQSGWFNSCSMLETDPPRRFCHRGFPINKRWLTDEERTAIRKGRVVVNVGLWLEDPDVDTITRLEEPFTVTAVREPARRIAVDRGVLFPFNSQNTAFHRDLLPCLYLLSISRGGEELLDNNNFRYDDIWMSFFLKIITDAMGDLVCIGPPLVRQKRNPHDLLIDLRKEMRPMEMTSILSDILPAISIAESTYQDCYDELIEELRIKAAFNRAFPPEHKELLRHIIDGMALWSKTVQALS